MGYVVGWGTWQEKDSGPTTVDLPLPAGAAAGDMVISGYTINSATLTDTQTGYTTLEHVGSTGETLAPACWLGRRTLNGTDISNGYSQLSVPSGIGSGGTIVARGFTTTQDFTIVPLDKTATTGNFAFGAQTLTAVGVLCVYLVGQNTVAAGTFTEPSGYTETGDRSAGRNATMGFRIYGQNGTTGSITPVSSQTTRGVGILVGLRPVAEPGKFFALL